MTKPRCEISRPDRRIAARIETLAFLFDVSVTTVRRAIEEHGIQASERFGPPLYRVDEVEGALWPNSSGEAKVPPLGAVDEDPSVGAVRHAKTKGQNRGNRTAA